MATKKRMGGMKLSDFGGQTERDQAEPVTLPTAPAAPATTATVPPRVKPASNRKPQPKQEERLVTVNIKIRESQQEWLTDIAKQVRQNNDAPVPASDRVYPQHLIQTAIDLLQSADVDWQQIKNVQDLRQALKV